MRTFVIAVAVLLAFVQLSQQAVIPLPQPVLDLMGSRAMRYYHLFFHSVRLNYLRLGPKQQHALRNYGWEPPRSASAFISDGTEIALYGNDNGEDFLFMHRKMIEQVNTLTGDTAYGNVKGWATCPAPGDKDWPVPAQYVIAGQADLTAMINLFKSDDFYWNEIKPREDALFDDDNLRTMTLGFIGARLENEIHFFMHNRFSAYNPIGYRIQNPLTPVDYIDPKWDVPAYDWLGDFYSAHVSQTFWMIHGWVESRYEQWRVANSITRITWIGTWEGGPAEAYTDIATVSAISEKIPTLPSDTTDEEPVVIDPTVLAQIVELLTQSITGTPPASP